MLRLQRDLDTIYSKLLLNISRPSFSFLLFFYRATPSAYGSSQARGWIGAAAAGLCHSHNNTRSELHLWPVLQLVAMPDPLTNWMKPGIEPKFSWVLVRFFCFCFLLVFFLLVFFVLFCFCFLLEFFVFCFFVSLFCFSVFFFFFFFFFFFCFFFFSFFFFFFFFLLYS